ncbi:MAG: cupredoxin domain-containing protein [Rhodocyclaceae bacterium]|jgi:plastocyanin|nr:cupredoxin domain-containing protein [Rhodocyclaceae bacterium]
MWLPLLCSAALTGMPPARGDVAGETEPVVDVSIENYSFRPNEIALRIGGTVRWTNREKRTSHSVLFPVEGGLESERLFPGERWQRTFTQAGTYPYTCGPHPEMKGSIVVSE